MASQSPVCHYVIDTDESSFKTYCDGRIGCYVGGGNLSDDEETKEKKRVDAEKAMKRAEEAAEMPEKYRKELELVSSSIGICESIPCLTTTDSKEFRDFLALTPGQVAEQIVKGRRFFKGKRPTKTATDGNNNNNNNNSTS